MIQAILNRKYEGMDCTEDESTEIKGWLRNNYFKTLSQGDMGILSMIQYHFPLEYGEFCEENQID